MIFPVPSKLSCGCVFFFSIYIYPLVNIQKAIENGHRNSGFIHQQWWFSIVFCMFTRGYIYIYHLILLNIWQLNGLVSEMSHLNLSQQLRHIIRKTIRRWYSLVSWGLCIYIYTLFYIIFIYFQHEFLNALRWPCDPCRTDAEVCRKTIWTPWTSYRKAKPQWSWRF